ncbi:MAG: sulfotransferase [Anaerolineaceae bacterium]|nr:sulfotransferase [Anaerolineaceae bacterium]
MPSAIMLESPFFIVGCGRSGTTLLRRMIDAHPLLAVPVESLFMIDYLRVRDSVQNVPYKRLILGEHEFSEWELSVSEDDLAACNGVVEVIGELHERYAAKEGAQFWGQKTPRFVRYGHLLKAVYPHAKFIHVIRDPRAVAISLRKSNVHRSNVYFGAQRWQKDVQAGIDLKRDFPNDVLEVSYETLVSDTELTLREICDFLGIPFDEAMLNYHQQRESAYEGYHAQIHKNLNAPPKQERIEAWRKDLTPVEIALIEQVCSPLMGDLGYEPEQTGTTIPDDMIRSLKWERRTLGLYRQIRQYFQGRTRHLFYSIWRKYRLGLLKQDFSQINF